MRDTLTNLLYHLVVGVVGALLLIFIPIIIEKDEIQYKKEEPFSYLSRTEININGIKTHFLSFYLVKLYPVGNSEVDSLIVTYEFSNLRSGFKILGNSHNNIPEKGLGNIKQLGMDSTKKVTYQYPLLKKGDIINITLMTTSTAKLSVYEKRQKGLTFAEAEQKGFFSKYIAVVAIAIAVLTYILGLFFGYRAKQRTPSQG